VETEKEDEEEENDDDSIEIDEDILSNLDLESTFRDETNDLDKTSLFSEPHNSLSPSLFYPDTSVSPSQCALPIILEAAHVQEMEEETDSNSMTNSSNTTPVQIAQNTLSEPRNTLINDYFVGNYVGEQSANNTYRSRGEATCDKKQRRVMASTTMSTMTGFRSGLSRILSHNGVESYISTAFLSRDKQLPSTAQGNHCSQETETYVPTRKTSQGDEQECLSCCHLDTFHLEELTSQTSGLGRSLAHHCANLQKKSSSGLNCNVCVTQANNDKESNRFGGGNKPFHLKS